ncbi:uncharacterized protein [Rutidosis leptorrhynchoides]|uniref:uncharacterized protein n=1 Tax=Rutidosis leptorrhynchoides TaxID=125765 RepID=UPI003A991B0D
MELVAQRVQVQGLRIAQQLGIKCLDAYGELQLVANQVNGLFESHDASMQSYLELVQKMIEEFDVFRLTQVPRGQNKKADVLSKLAALAFNHLRKNVWVEELTKKSIDEKSTVAPIEEESPNWMTPKLKFLVEGMLPIDEKEARKVRMKTPMYTLVDGALYRTSFLGPRLLSAKVMCIGYYWPTIHKDAAEWAIDIVGPITACSGGIKFLVVAIDYFTKWVEAKALVTITSRRIRNFFWEDIVCSYGIPNEIFSENRTQFEGEPFRSWCQDLNSKQSFTSVAHPQANGQCKVTNWDIVKGIKERLGLYGKEWVDDLPSVLWAHQTIHKNSTGETPFILVYGTEAIIPAEILVPTNRVRSFDESSNSEGLPSNLDMLKERKEITAIREAVNKHKISKYYDKRFKPLSFKVEEYVWRNNEAS